MLSRRELLAALPFAYAPARAADPPALPFGFSLYGMKALALPDALKACAEIGYRGVEFALMPGYPAEPKLLTADARKDVRKWLADAGLAVLGLMENLAEPATDAVHKANIERLKAATDLSHALSPNAPPCIESVLGGKPTEWDKVKEELAERLSAWADVGRASKVVIAVKPHVANALHTIEGAKWLIKEVNSPWLRLAFDYSHFALRGVKLADAVGELIPVSAFVHVKDAKGTADKFEFVLPGAGSTDYAAYRKLLAEAKYAGPVVVEVSGHVSNKPNYDAVAAAKASFAALAPQFAPRAKR
jgi:sugar phosphate isomerase/epimerase